MVDLKCCPFCGHKRIEVWRIHGTHKYYCECAKCHWCGEAKLFRRRAIRAWNELKGVYR